MRNRVWLTDRQGQILALAIGVLATALIWFGVVNPVWSWLDDRQTLLRQRQAMLYKMRDLAPTLPALRDALARNGAAGSDTVTLLGASDAIAAADLQDRIQVIAETSGASLTSVETLPVMPKVGPWRKVSLRISLNTSWPDLVKLIQSMQQSPKLILIDEIQFHHSNAQTQAATRPIQASMTLYGFREANTSSGLEKTASE